MKPILFLSLACLLAFPAHAARRMGEAQVRADANNRPCFTISEGEEKRSGAPNFHAITVTGGGHLLWHMAMPRGRTFPVAFSMCIPYAGRVPALPQTPFAPLEAGKVYIVQIDSRPGKGATAPLRYQARFCLARRPDGGSTVVQIGADMRPGRNLYGCLPGPA